MSWLTWSSSSASWNRPRTISLMWEYIEPGRDMVNVVSLLLEHFMSFFAVVASGLHLRSANFEIIAFFILYCVCNFVATIYVFFM